MVINMSEPKTSRKRKFTKNKKKGWKNIDITDLEEALEDERLQLRTGGLVAEKRDEDLFLVDTSKKVEEITVPPTKRRKREFKTLKCHSNLEPDSRVPPITIPHNIKKASELDIKIDKVAKKIRRNNAVMVNAQAQREKHLKEKLKERKKAEELPVADYDLWNTKDYMAKEDEHFMVVTRKKRVHPAQHYTQKPSARPAVEVPHPGASYNPTFEDHQDLLAKANEKEVLKEREEKKLYNALDAKFKTVSHADLEAHRLSEMAAGLLDESDEDENEYTAEELEKISVNPPVRRENKKTKTQRNKEQKQKILEEQKMKLKKNKQASNQILRLKSIKAEISKKEKLAAKKAALRAEKHAKAPFATRKLGKVKYEDSNLELKLSEEIEGSLRLLKPEGDLLQDRYKSLQKRNVVEPRNKAKKTRKYRKKTFEKPSHKNFA